jgi:hypothetical protein
VLKKIAACLLPFVICLPASAQTIPVPSEQWAPVTQASNGEIFSIDKGTIGANGNTRTFWVNVNHNQNSNVAITRIYMGANCASNAVAYGWLLQANWQGQVIANGNPNMNPVQAQAGTVNDNLVNAVCTGFSTDPQLNALTRARQADLKAITRAMQIGASMFK